MNLVDVALFFICLISYGRAGNEKLDDKDIISEIKSNSIFLLMSVAFAVFYATSSDPQISSRLIVMIAYINFWAVLLYINRQCLRTRVARQKQKLEDDLKKDVSQMLKDNEIKKKDKKQKE